MNLLARPNEKSSVVVYTVQAILVVLLLRLLLAGGYRAAIADTDMQGIDHGQYYRAALRLQNGEDLYITDSQHLYADAYPDTPWLAIIFRANSGLSQHQSYVRWLKVMLACLVSSCAICAWSAKSPYTSCSTLLCLFLISGFRYWPTVDELALGNVQFVSLLFVSLMCCCASRRWWTGVSLCIAFAAMVKSWMIGFAIAPLLARRYWHALLAIILSGVMLILAFTIVGFHQLPKYVRAMQMYAVQPKLITLSASGIARQFFSRTEHMQPLAVSHTLRITFVAAHFVFVATLAFIAFKHSAKGDPMNSMMLIPLVGAFILILLTLCHMQYFIVLLPAAWFLMAATLGCSPKTIIVCVFCGLTAYLLLAGPLPTETPTPEWARHGISRLLTAMPLFAADIAAISITFGIWWSGKLILPIEIKLLPEEADVTEQAKHLNYHPSV